MIAKAVGDLGVAVGNQEVLSVVDSEFELLTWSDHQVYLEALHSWNVSALNWDGPWLIRGEFTDNMDYRGRLKLFVCTATCHRFLIKSFISFFFLKFNCRFTEILYIILIAFQIDSCIKQSNLPKKSQPLLLLAPFIKPSDNLLSFRDLTKDLVFHSFSKCQIDDTFIILASFKQLFFLLFCPCLL